MMIRNTKDNVQAFCKEFHATFFWYIHSFIDTYEKVKKFIKFLCLHYDDGVVGKFLTFQKVMNAVTLLVKLQNEFDKQRLNAEMNFLKVQKSVSRNKHKKRKMNELSEMNRLRKSQIAYKTDEDFDILYNACIVFALGYLSVPLLQVTFVLFFPFWVMVFIFIMPPIIIAAFLITTALCAIDCMTRISDDGNVSMISSRRNRINRQCDALF
mmetsp:Transcript_180/g.262  ORF Transcript_180/g.262 Transcript_180/m.262 type:complete len:211 (-) Transcript_180:249-881(-)